MILVITGTSSWDFSRLIKEMDRIAGKTDEEIVMQISDTRYEPKNAKFFRFVSEEEFESLFQKARLIISHAGIGSIISTFRHKKPLILVPRRKKFYEHFDDHQTDIAGELEKENKCIVVWDIQNLEMMLNVNQFPKIDTNKECSLIVNLKNYLEKIEANLV